MLVKDEAREAAQEVLTKHWDGQLPVDPVALAAALGIDVEFGEFEGALSGAIQARDGQAKITLATNETYARQIFTCAHEIGHYIERQRADDPDYTFTESADSDLYENRGGEWSLHEFYADEFAGNLLMPLVSFKSFYEQGASLNALSEIFAVSRAAVNSRIRRLKQDGLLGEQPV